jgi:hypothetical protein
MDFNDRRAAKPVKTDYMVKQPKTKLGQKMLYNKQLKAGYEALRKKSN